jgi:hypothetical protein
VLCVVVVVALGAIPAHAQQGDGEDERAPAPPADPAGPTDDPKPPDDPVTPVADPPVDPPDGPPDPNAPVPDPNALTPAPEDRVPAPTPEEAEQARNKAIADKFAPPTAAEVADSPPNDEAHGMARNPKSAARHLWWIPRALLFVPRVALEVVMSPVRGLLYLNERYALQARFKEIFFNDTGTAGLFPIASFQSGFGLTGGARFIHKDLFGAGIKTSVKGTFGGRIRQSYALSLGTGDWLDNAEIEIEGRFDARPKDFFYGIGNGPVIAPPMIAIDPLQADAPNVRSRFRQDLGRFTLIGNFQLPADFSLRVSSALLIRDFDDSDKGGPEQDIFTNFETDRLTGFDLRLKTLYNELELRFDTRRAVSKYEAAATPGGGWLLGGYLGYAEGLYRTPSDYFRYGLDLQRYFRLAQGPRTLALRALFEGVTGTYQDVPFVDLPRLGGPLLLRGYDLDRFRDRAMALFSAEYQWDLSQMLGGVLFVDTGRVFRSFDDFNFKNYRLGYGFALQAHRKNSFLFRFGIASTIDAADERNILFTFSFDPVYDPRARVDRR